MEGAGQSAPFFVSFRPSISWSWLAGSQPCDITCGVIDFLLIAIGRSGFTFLTTDRARDQLREWGNYSSNRRAITWA